MYHTNTEKSIAERVGLEPTNHVIGSGFRDQCLAIRRTSPLGTSGPGGNRTPDSSMPWTRVTAILRALSCAPGRSRTSNLFLRTELLIQLSYGGSAFNNILTEYMVVCNSFQC